MEGSLQEKMGAAAKHMQNIPLTAQRCSHRYDTDLS